MFTPLVRPAVAGDARQIFAVHAGAVRAAFEQARLEAPKQPADDKLEAFWREAIRYSEPQVHVALDGNELIGFVGFDRSRDAKSKPITGELWNLYVLPSYWGRGVGLALWDAAREGLLEEGCTEVTLWVPLGHERAMRFIELAGFKRELSTARTAVISGVKLEEIRLKRSLGQL